MVWTLASVGLFVMLRLVAPKADLLLSAIPLALSGLSVVFLQRLDLQREEIASVLGAAPPPSFAMAQMLWLVVGTTLAVLVIRFLPLNYLNRYPMLLGGLAMALLLMPLLPFGLEVNGARLWVRFGETQFQPGELGKVFFAIFLGAYLSRFDLFAQTTFHRRVSALAPPVRQFGPVVATLLLAGVILVFERDLGTALLLTLLFAAVATVATGRWLIAAFATLITVIGAWVATLIFDHVDRRFQAWLSPFNSPDDVGYQILQSIFGLSSGGIFGEGLGSGSPNLVPFAASDFILAVIGEEVGYAGLLAVLGIFAILFGRGFRLALNQKRPTQQLITVSLTALLALQTLLVVAGIARLLPLTGLTTPFLSYGGSSMLACWLVIGILIKYSNQLDQPRSEVVNLESETTMVIRR